MFAKGTHNPWLLRQDTSDTIDFCLWTLQKDGLSAPPFDQHPDGDGSLRSLGMMAESWLDWFIHIVQLQQEHDQELQDWTQAHRAGKQQLPPSPNTRIQQPASEWHGETAIGQRLTEDDAGIWHLLSEVAGPGGTIIYFYLPPHQETGRPLVGYIQRQHIHDRGPSFAVK